MNTQLCIFPNDNVSFLLYVSVVNQQELKEFQEQTRGKKVSKVWGMEMRKENPYLC